MARAKGMVLLKRHILLQTSNYAQRWVVIRWGSGIWKNRRQIIFWWWWQDIEMWFVICNLQFLVCPLIIFTNVDFLLAICDLCFLVCSIFKILSYETEDLCPCPPSVPFSTFGEIFFQVWYIGIAIVQESAYMCKLSELPPGPSQRLLHFVQHKGSTTS